MPDILGLGDRPIVLGMVHLQALPGAPDFAGDLTAVRDAALRDARSLADGGIDAVLVENYWDAPFFPGSVPPETVAQMTAIVAAIREGVAAPVGVNVLRNDGCAALAVAQATGAAFIRVNVLTGARLTDQGIVHGIAHELLRLRSRLGADSIRILADVNVKHSAPLAPYDTVQEVEDALERGGADAVIVSGSGTGKTIDATELHAVRQASGGAPVLVGSGVDADSLPRLAADADGFIVGTALKVEGAIAAPVDPERVRRLMAARG